MPLAYSLLDERPRNVVVVRALPGLGDMLCAVPALRALRGAVPRARITLLGLDSAGWMLERFPQYVDELWELPGFPGLPERPARMAEIRSLLARAGERQFDLAIQLHGNGVVTNVLTALLDARRCAGLYMPGLWCPDDDTFVPCDAERHEVRRLISVVARLGAPDAGDELEFPVRDADRLQLETLGLPSGRYACVHPGAADASRRWPADRFARVADDLREAGLTVVLTGSPQERGVTAEVAGLMRHPCVDVAGRTSLGSLAALIEGAALVVCNDSGPSHLAAALRTSSVVVFGGSPETGSDPYRWAPLNDELHRSLWVEHPAWAPDALAGTCAARAGGGTLAGAHVELADVRSAVARQLVRAGAKEPV